MKKKIVLGLCVTMMISAIGCGQKGATESSGESSAVSENAANQTVASGELEPEAGASLVLWMDNDDYNEISELTDKEKKPLTLYTDASKSDYSQYTENTGIPT